MKRLPSILSGVKIVTVLALGVPTSVEAQRRQGGGGGQGGGGSQGGGGRTSGGGGGDRAVPRGDSGGGGRTAAPAPVSGGSAATPQRGSEGERSGGERAEPASRQRGGQSSGDVAVARRGPRPTGGRPIFIDRGYYRSYYPWGYGGYGFGGYYGGYYDPWFYGSGYNGYGYGGYGGGYYPGSYYSGFEDGSLRLKVKPKNGSVYVDGYFAGQVDEFDGIFQRLHVEPGPHRIEIRADGYAPLSFEIRVPPGRTVNYGGELRRLP
jgi:PEGA domain-containing protein